MMKFIETCGVSNFFENHGSIVNEAAGGDRAGERILYRGVGAAGAGAGLLRGPGALSGVLSGQPGREEPKTEKGKEASPGKKNSEESRGLRVHGEKKSWVSVKNILTRTVRRGTKFRNQLNSVPGLGLATLRFQRRSIFVAGVTAGFGVVDFMAGEAAVHGGDAGYFGDLLHLANLAVAGFAG